MTRAWALLLLVLLMPGSALSDSANLEGGVFVAHHPPGLQYSAMEDYCERYFQDFAIDSCSEQNNRIDLEGNQGQTSVWYVLAAWGEEKEWCGAEFGFAAFDSTIYGFYLWGPCSPDGALEIQTDGWPGPNAGVSLSISDTPWWGNFVPVYWFAGYAYEQGQVPLGVNPATDFGGTANCETPPQSWGATAFGGMGIFEDGASACPEELDEGGGLDGGMQPDGAEGYEGYEPDSGEGSGSGDDECAYYEDYMHWVCNESDPGSALDVTVVDDRAYVADSTSGLLIISIADPDSPVILEAVDTPGCVQGVAVSGDYAYIAVGAYDQANASLRVVQISEFVVVGIVDMPGDARDVAVAGDYAYVVINTPSPSLQVVDIANPSSPDLIEDAAVPLSAPWSVALSGTHLYVADSFQGLRVIDISDHAPIAHDAHQGAGGCWRESARRGSTESPATGWAVSRNALALNPCCNVRHPQPSCGGRIDKGGEETG